MRDFKWILETGKEILGWQGLGLAHPAFPGRPKVSGRNSPASRGSSRARGIQIVMAIQGDTRWAECWMLMGSLVWRPRPPDPRPKARSPAENKEQIAQSGRHLQLGFSAAHQLRSVV